MMEIKGKMKFLFGIFFFFAISQFSDGIPVKLEQEGILRKMGEKVGKILGKAESVLDCDVCVLLVDLLRDFVARNVSDEEVVNIVTDFCVALNIEVEEVCRGMLNQEIPELMYVVGYIDFNETTNVNLCSFYMGGDCLTLEQYLDVYGWNITFPSPEPPYVPPPTPSQDSPKLRILHISDIHMDPDYAEGSVANCDEPLCCRPWSKMANENDSVNYSGKWGAVEADCDLPQTTLENMMQYIAENVQFDAIYWTGDVPPHDVWNQTKDSNLAVLRQVAEVIKRFVPEMIVYPAVGNHESDPVNSFPVPPVYDDWDISYLYNQLDETWSTFVPDLDDDSVLKGGYYASQIRPGLRVISLNMNYCNGGNAFLVIESQDPTSEMQWLIDQLDDAERNNEKVHIIGHIPPGSCTYVWGRNFRDILDRYKGTIAGSFYGHTHKDEFEIVYDDVNVTWPIHLSNVGPSATFYGNLNPSFRVYTVDGDYDGSSYAVLDYEEYYMDVARANQDDAPTWQLLYTALDSYGLNAYTPTEWDDFVTRMETDDDLFQLFYSHYHRMTPWGDCDGGCRRGLLCDLRSGWTGYTYPGC